MWHIFLSLKMSNVTVIQFLELLFFKELLGTVPVCYIPGGKMSWVSLEVAIGTMTLQCIPFLPPSIAKVLHNPTRPNFAAL